MKEKNSFSHSHNSPFLLGGRERDGSMLCGCLCHGWGPRLDPQEPGPDIRDDDFFDLRPKATNAAVTLTGGLAEE